MQLSIVAVFVVLALWTFGVFELRLPGGLMGKAMQFSNAGGALGALGAGLFAGVLAAPCIKSGCWACCCMLPSKKMFFQGSWMFASLGFGMGAPYILLAVSGGMLQKIPRSGGWMIDVKRILGTVLLMLALYYARGFVSSDIYSILFGLLFIFVGLYINPFVEMTGISRLLSSLIRLAAFVALLYGSSQLWKQWVPVSASAAHPQVSQELQWEDYSDTTLKEANELNSGLSLIFKAKFGVQLVVKWRKKPLIKSKSFKN